LAAGLLAGCASPEAADQSTPEPAQAAPAAESVALWLAPYLPEEMTAGLSLPENTLQVDDPSRADLLVDVGADHLLAQWIYVLAAPFDTVADGISLAQLQALWQGTLTEGVPLEKLIMNGGTKSVFEKLWGSASQATVEVVADNALMEIAWSSENTWAILPFEKLEPRWKVIALDGQSPVQKAFNSDALWLESAFLDCRECGSCREIPLPLTGRNPRSPCSRRSIVILTS
jgi:hypothetical protein